MEGLPEEILIEIFSNFCLKSLNTVFANVCTRWKEVITQTARLNITFILKDENDLKFLNNFRGSHHIRCLDIRMEVDLINSLFEHLEGKCPKITHLTMHRCNSLSERHLHRLNICFPDLKHIDVFLTSKFITENFIDIITKMKSIVLNNQIDDTALKTIALRCPQLTELHMYGSVQYYPITQLQNLLSSRFDRLNKITLRCCELTDKACETIGHCSSLQSLQLYHCWMLTDSGVLNLLNLTNLHLLHITGLKLVSKMGIGNFVQNLNMKFLSELNMSSSAFNDDHAATLCSKVPYLKILELWNCRELTLIGILRIINGLKRLYILDLNMDLPIEIINKIDQDTDIVYLNFLIRDGSRTADNRKLILTNAFRSYDELCFRGNGEGFRANLLCYSDHRRIPTIFVDKQSAIRKHAYVFD